jgi:hypothetical protein
VKSKDIQPLSQDSDVSDFVVTFAECFANTPLPSTVSRIPSLDIASNTL